MIESLVEQIEARFAEAQAQMADPDVIGDRRRYAEAGRLFNQLSTAAKLAEEWVGSSFQVPTGSCVRVSVAVAGI